MIVVYTPRITSRIKYSFRLILGEILGIEYIITDKKEDLFKPDTFCFSYDREETDGIPYLQAAGLLTQKGISGQDPSVGHYLNTPCLFQTFHPKALLPYDVFSAAFYMVSRYEEYLPFRKDKYGRFKAEESLAYQKGFLMKPVVNLWAKQLAEKLKELWPGLETRLPRYQYIPTIDVDQAYSYLHKGLLRTVGGYSTALLKRDFNDLRMRTLVHLRRSPDPFYTFDKILTIHQKYQLKPLFFVLFGDYGNFDKNTPVYCQEFVCLIKQLADEAQVGIHPSFASNSEPSKLKKEVNGLSEIIHRPIKASRQHFLKLDFPQTFRNLINLDITHDFSLGFAGHIGFRAGISTPFRFYDLDLEEETSLIMTPLVLMDGTLKDYMRLSPSEILSKTEKLVQTIKETGGTFVSLFHNDTFDESGQWKGWTDIYEEMIKIAIKPL